MKSILWRKWKCNFILTLKHISRAFSEYKMYINVNFESVYDTLQIYERTVNWCMDTAPTS